MWNFFKSRAAGVLGVTVYIIWKKISCMEDGRAGGCLGRRGGGISDTCRMIWFTKVYDERGKAGLIVKSYG